MLIDWFTVGAQALNFLILVWLLKRFLYKPILDAIDAREKRIAAELADAAAKEADAKKERDEFQHKNAEFDQQRAALLSKATDEANAERQRLLDEARRAADALSATRQDALRNDAHHLNQAIMRRTQQEVFAIARKTLADLATTSLEERLGEVFTRRLREMDGKAKEGLAKALKTASSPALVRSAFDLPPKERATIQDALNETFSADIHLRFETAPDVVSGIELTTNGQKVAWSIAGYLASLEQGVDELLKEQSKSQARTEATAAPKSEAKPESRPEVKAAPETKAKATLEAAPPAKAESETDAKAKPQVAPTPPAKPEPTAASKAESKPESTPEAKAAPETKAKATPEAAPPVKAESETDTKAKPVVESRAASETGPTRS